MPSLDDLDPVFQAAGQEWNVDPMLLKAMAKQESGGRMNAVSSKNAQGLMQIIPETQKALGVTDPNDPVQSIWGAAKYMDQALTAENGSVEQALLYYHGGPGWRGAYGPESRGYVPAIAGHYKALMAAQQPQTPDSSQPVPAASAAVPDADAPMYTAPPSKTPMVLGDSLASPQGLGGSGVVGAGPKAILGAINGLPDEQVSGRDVVLSSGASNGPQQVALVEDQIKALQGKNAGNITIVGVGDNPKLKGVNETLQDIATRNGVRFVPLDPAQLGPDRVHPTGAGYKQLRTKLALR